MVKRLTKTTILIILIALAAGCDPAAPTATPVPTAPPVPRSPTVAPASPTETLVPRAVTSARPTRTPVPSIGVPTAATPTSVPATRPAVATATPLSVAAVDQLIESIADLGTMGQFAGAVLIANDGAPVYTAAYGLASRTKAHQQGLFSSQAENINTLARLSPALAKARPRVDIVQF